MTPTNTSNHRRSRTSFLLRCILPALLFVIFNHTAYGRDHIKVGAQAYVAKNYAEAERHFRAAIAANPGDYRGYMWLGHTLNEQDRYADEIEPYEKTLSFDAPGNAASVTERRVVTDHLVYAYYSTGKVQQAEDLLRRAIKRDPGYPLNYYNLAGLSAEKKDLDQAIENLRLAFRNRNNLLKGESFPDPRQDPSFRPYRYNPKFQKLLKEMGFE